jgi:hypothetical protein
MSSGLRDAIRQAYKECPDRRDGEEIIREIETSSFLRDKKWVNLPWLLKTSKGRMSASRPNVSPSSYRWGTTIG